MSARLTPAADRFDDDHCHWFRGGCVAFLRHVHVYDPGVLVHGPIHIAPHAGDLDVGLIHEPAITLSVPNTRS